MFRLRLLSSFVRRFSSPAAPAADTPVKALSTPENETVKPDGYNKIESLAKEDHLNALGKLKYRQFAMLLCFHGLNYLGFQFNIHGRTIEQELFKALFKCGAIPEAHINHAGYYLNFSRASRTDSGVSALRKVVCLRLAINFDFNQMNQVLPPDIRVLGLKRVTHKFDAQVNCVSRSYNYIMPSFALRHYQVTARPHIKYRIDAETLQKANQLFQMFTGTHRFHNYTDKIDMWDQRSLRSILKVSVSEPFLIGDLEMVEFEVHGASFMLHQIRKMVGMVIAIMRGRVPFNMLEDTLTSVAMPTPTAPSLGLILNNQYFRKVWKTKTEPMEPLEWPEVDLYVDKFKMEHIVPQMAVEELTEKTMENFLDHLKRHTFRPDPASSKLIKLGNYDLAALAGSTMQAPLTNDSKLRDKE